MARGHYQRRSKEEEEDSEATTLGIKPQRVLKTAKAAVDVQVLEYLMT